MAILGDDGMFDWNDLRYFLAVARTGSTLGASKNMRVSQATVSRRITVLEEAVGTALFIRRPTGYTLTPRGEAMLPVAETVEASVAAFTDGIAAEARRLNGTVRLTMVEVSANEWIIPALPKLRARHPDIKLEILASDNYLDLVRGEADIAIRFGSKPEQESLIVRHLLDLQETVYATPEIANRYGYLSCLTDLKNYPVIAVGTPQGLAYMQDWLAESAPDAKITHHASSLPALVASAKAGLGVAVLPCVMGDQTPELVRLIPPIPELATPCWLVTSESARRQPHIRAVMDFIIDLLGNIGAMQVKPDAMADIKAA
jgi:DNA-binding transcriptional LysR family regulator